MTAALERLSSRKICIQTSVYYQYWEQWKQQLGLTRANCIAPWLSAMWTSARHEKSTNRKTILCIISSPLCDSFSCIFCLLVLHRWQNFLYMSLLWYGDETELQNILLKVYIMFLCLYLYLCGCQARSQYLLAVSWWFTNIYLLAFLSNKLPRIYADWMINFKTLTWDILHK